MHIKDTFPELYQIRKRPLSIEGVRRRLSEKRGREFWQSLEELASSEEFEELLHREFPQHASEWDEGADRRTFLKLMGASLALAGLLLPAARDHRPIRPPARRDCPRQAALLRHRDAMDGGMCAAPRAQPHGPTDEDRRE
jgi:MoCo/4Fe-4S cofactor protein with predicted Tat translocation signal